MSKYEEIIFGDVNARWQWGPLVGRVGEGLVGQDEFGRREGGKREDGKEAREC